MHYLFNLIENALGDFTSKVFQLPVFIHCSISIHAAQMPIPAFIDYDWIIRYAVCRVKFSRIFCPLEKHCFSVTTELND